VTSSAPSVYRYRGSVNIKFQVIVGVGDICWTLWLSCNDIVFNKQTIFTPMQVIYKVTYWIISLWMLQKEEEKNTSITSTLEWVTMEIFTCNG
jgi:hypothetical protein